MTDAELLDGLQRLFEGTDVVVLRTCRSGLKLELAKTELALPDTSIAFRDHREYFGGVGTEGAGKLGNDVRAAIEKAVRAEVGNGR